MNERSGRCVEVNGATLHYKEHGDGAPLILMHGGLSSSAQWEPLVPELAHRFRVITPDSRGHGRSTNPSGELSYALIADDVAALIAALGLRCPVVGGWSDGGQVTLELGARHPVAAGALIVGAAYPDFDAGGLREAHIKNDWPPCSDASQHVQVRPTCAPTARQPADARARAAVHAATD